MKRQLVASAMIALFLAPAHTAAADSAAAEPTTLAAVNRALRERTAEITLVSGETIAEARGVSLTTREIRWRAEQRFETRPVSEVLRITARPRSRFWRSVAVGALVGATAGGLAGSQSGGGSSNPDEWSGLGRAVVDDDAALAGAGLVGAAVGALLGAAVGGLLGPLPEKIVFEGPAERYLAEEDESVPDERAAFLADVLRRQRPD